MNERMQSSREALTPRERDIARRVACGFRSDQIAKLENVSERTVRAHLDRIYTKLGLMSRTHLAVWSLMVGLIEPNEIISAWREHLPEVPGCGKSEFARQSW